MDIVTFGPGDSAPGDSQPSRGIPLRGIPTSPLGAVGGLGLEGSDFPTGFAEETGPSVRARRDFLKDGGSNGARRWDGALAGLRVGLGVRPESLPMGSVLGDSRYDFARLTVVVGHEALHEDVARASWGRKRRERLPLPL